MESCVPNPTCESRTYKWSNLDKVQPNYKYLGDPKSADWVSSGKLLTSGDSLIMTMAPDTVGTLLANNHYIWYGKVSARMKSSRGKGVVTAFILMSDVKDEIDFEFVGANLENAETNYYFQGVPDWTKQIGASLSDTYENYHTYEIDWKPDHITWSIDGQAVRTLEKADTYNETTKQYMFPQTPSRLQLSLWPAGLKSAAQGTVEWAGGYVDWDSEDIKKTGYYYAIVDKVTVECYDPPANSGDGDKSYIYKDMAVLEGSVERTNKVGVLKSFYADGEHLDRDPNAPKTKTKQTTTTSAADATSTADNTSTTDSAATTTTTEAAPTSSHDTDNLIPGVVGAGSGIHGDPNKDENKDSKDDDNSKDSKDEKSHPVTNPAHADQDGDFDQGAQDHSGAITVHHSLAAALVAAVFVIVVL
ncbi:putative glycosidase crf2 [Ascosphaera aggregata]|nr:putative glycosidase crf2 [Ascosphaera aggregata]